MIQRLTAGTTGTSSYPTDNYCTVLALQVRTIEISLQLEW